ncbi:hypothetical protein A2631_00180 [Candidatus Daviesbacteria bacterium RIFCSPHIGHO2_01_FULL_44_29]|uniref:Uncharacterized protein n=1 Tax=Candidatus Daviesbacteria bacterium RIFCSPHIGHO2_02_FULL_43_12 TaxID=1797776 RepID=A0A1F5KIA8_9BACT|nr:MAG: hypothetical protein A2631_00180 [Candidatus Daviesbacteria bacterium RIFCSPHIGHO2_01_FULL_44_29]OGE38988.1 MAG: hypothetical protein A3E86_05765 [Candidatus Daviesbacteria bacterium RIFCSPHIGHO2_12_FULL_47_45]OGE40550.1 MAG: hypothetical protein A3D25_00315 [Candidatus Daviesbacteria bacterium RIFCSPHIGHO2_02_FULL_43_12]OGE70108.1 MAG: hypothetical protein A3B55_00085 [Candidatus Daviesbacteria bacterium RIFCSPLOWO2_01_FULL_43_15]
MLVEQRVTLETKLRKGLPIGVEDLTDFQTRIDPSLVSLNPRPLLARVNGSGLRAQLGVVRDPVGYLLYKWGIPQTGTAPDL